MGITLREASEKVGVTRQTLMKAIKTGRVSAEKADRPSRPEAAILARLKNEH